MEIVVPTWAVSMIVVLIGILGAFAVQRFVVFRKSSDNFRSTVLQSLSGLYPHPVNWFRDSVAIDGVLRSAFPTLQAAVGEFRDALPWWRRRAFDTAWFRFYCSTGREVDKQSQCYHHYMPFISTSIVNGKEVTVDTTGIYKDNFKHNVDSLLKFAKKT